MKGKKIMITAGPTYEKIDPVRFIGNYSSGKMGFALAEECCRRGAEVTLVAGPVSLSCSEAIHRIDVESCEEMYQAATQAFASTDAAILCAAVADFKPSEIADRKIKREKDDLELRLVPTHDIAAALGKMKQNISESWLSPWKPTTKRLTHRKSAKRKMPISSCLTLLAIREPHSVRMITR